MLASAFLKKDLRQALPNVVITHEDHVANGALQYLKRLLDDSIHPDSVCDVLPYDIGYIYRTSTKSSTYAIEWLFKRMESIPLEPGFKSSKWLTLVSDKVEDGYQEVVIVEGFADKATVSLDKYVDDMHRYTLHIPVDKNGVDIKLRLILGSDYKLKVEVFIRGVQHIRILEVGVNYIDIAQPHVDPVVTDHVSTGGDSDHCEQSSTTAMTEDNRSRGQKGQRRRQRGHPQ